MADLPTKALSVRQPWAWAIVGGCKDVENRDWSTRFRGPVLIHASRGMTRAEYEDFLDTARAISRTHPFPSGVALLPYDELQRGGVVGIAEIIGCVQEHASPWFVGRYAFVMANAQPVPFVACRGQLGFFDVPSEVIDALDAARAA
ncbi:ASCH domain-containing protein [Methylobacterium sp. JK268]